jgi:hypothetical protein
MDRDDNGVALRRAVAERLRKFFADWTGQLAAGTTQIWDGVQRRLSESPPDAPPPARHLPMQQQQQSKIEPGDKK